MFAQDNYKFRTLLRFDKLHEYLPASATINQARLNLTFLNWEDKTNTLQVWGGDIPAKGWRLCVCLLRVVFVCCGLCSPAVGCVRVL